MSCIDACACHTIVANSAARMPYRRQGGSRLWRFRDHQLTCLGRTCPLAMAVYCKLCQCHVQIRQWDEHQCGRKHRSKERESLDAKVAASVQEIDRADTEAQRSEEARFEKMRLEESESASDSDEKEDELQRAEEEKFWKEMDAINAYHDKVTARNRSIQERENRLWDLANRSINRKDVTDAERKETLAARAVFKQRNERRNNQISEYYAKVVRPDSERYRENAARERGEEEAARRAMNAQGRRQDEAVREANAARLREKALRDAAPPFPAASQSSSSAAPTAPPAYQ